ncbi:hypothetical protein ACI3QN_11195 [Propionibacterium freudenreichii]|uniref:hypothetical protein n=1 Tax=Propionibacterium freudenreichii TaxID=1744 RepID=UPI003855536F
MTVQNAPATDEYTAYEYATVRVPRTFEPLFRDTYPGFGWTVENPRATTSVASVPLGRTQRSETVTLQLKRDRNLKNRDMVRALQEEADTALTTIISLERSKTSRAMVVAVTIGIVGSAFLAGSVFAMNAGLAVLSVALGALGLFGWVGGGISYRQVKRRRARHVDPLIENALDTLHEASRRAAHLLR